MSNLGALVVHGLFEHEGRHKDNVEWLKNLGIETYSLNLPGHGDIDEKGHIETWNENIEAICFCFPSGWIPGRELKADLSKLHQPVADNDLLLKSSKKLSQHMNKQTIRRWVWNVTTIPGLSNHPSEDKPLLNDFENLYFRLETQISTPLDEFSSLFLVKVDVVSLRDVWDEIILESINSMSENVIKYKNLSEIKKFLNS